MGRGRPLGLARTLTTLPGLVKLRRRLKKTDVAHKRLASALHFATAWVTRTPHAAKWLTAASTTRIAAVTAAAHVPSKEHYGDPVDAAGDRAALAGDRGTFRPVTGLSRRRSRRRPTTGLRRRPETRVQREGPAGALTLTLGPPTGAWTRPLSPSARRRAPRGVEHRAGAAPEPLRLRSCCGGRAPGLNPVAPESAGGPRQAKVYRAHRRGLGDLAPSELARLGVTTFGGRRHRVACAGLPARGGGYAWSSTRTRPRSRRSRLAGLLGPRWGVPRRHRPLRRERGRSSRTRRAGCVGGTLAAAHSRRPRRNSLGPRRGKQSPSPRHRRGLSH